MANNQTKDTKCIHRFLANASKPFCFLHFYFICDFLKKRFVESGAKSNQKQRLFGPKPSHLGKVRSSIPSPFWRS
ncbi:MAG: hypothetical protein ACOYMU_06230, partial [Phycisphaerales bacterium]